MTDPLYARAATSPANLKLRHLIHTAEVFCDQLGDWLEQHGTECDCDHCTYGEPESNDRVKEDLGHLLWSFGSMLQLLLGTSAVYLDAPDGDTPAPQLTQVSGG